MDASLGGERSAAGKEEFVDITIDYLELTSKSPAVAQTLYRGDEAAYRAACGRTHTLLAKKRKRPLRVAVSPECLTMMQLGRGMKAQVVRADGARLARLQAENVCCVPGAVAPESLCVVVNKRTCHWPPTEPVVTADVRVFAS